MYIYIKYISCYLIMYYVLRIKSRRSKVAILPKESPVPPKEYKVWTTHDGFNSQSIYIYVYLEVLTILKSNIV